MPELPSYPTPEQRRMIWTAATAFSGVPAFIELLDLTALQSPKDWFKEELDELTK